MLPTWSKEHTSTPLLNNTTTARVQTYPRVIQWHLGWLVSQTTHCPYPPPSPPTNHALPQNPKLQRMVPPPYLVPYNSSTWSSGPSLPIQQICAQMDVCCTISTCKRFPRTAPLPAHTTVHPHSNNLTYPCGCWPRNTMGAIPSTLSYCPKPPACAQWPPFSLLLQLLPLSF